MVQDFWRKESLLTNVFLSEIMCLYEKLNLCVLMFNEMMFTKDISRENDFLKSH